MGAYSIRGREENLDFATKQQNSTFYPILPLGGRGARNRSIDCTGPEETILIIVMGAQETYTVAENNSGP